MPSDECMWSNKNTLKFIDLLATEPAIWNPKEKQYKLKHKVHEAWMRIGEAMNITVEELKTKKKSLMACFRPLVNKKKASLRSGSSADEVFQPKWFAYDAMENFLGSVYEVNESSIEDGICHSDIKMSPSSSSSFQAQQSNDTDMPLSPPQKENSQKTNANIAPRSNFLKRRRIPDTFLDGAEKKISDSFDALRYLLEGKRVEEDECDAYAKLLAKKLRKYPERVRDRIMYKIDGLLLENPYPEEQVSSASSSQSSFLYYPNCPSPVYITPHSPMQAYFQEDSATHQESTIKLETLESPVEINMRECTRIPQNKEIKKL